jgi:hypothetical protein
MTERHFQIVITTFTLEAISPVDWKGMMEAVTTSKGKEEEIFLKKLLIN